MEYWQRIELWILIGSLAQLGGAIFCGYALIKRNKILESREIVRNK